MFDYSPQVDSNVIENEIRTCQSCIDKAETEVRELENKSLELNKRIELLATVERQATNNAHLRATLEVLMRQRGELTVKKNDKNKQIADYQEILNVLHSMR